MKSIETTFNQIKKQHPDWEDLICFAHTIWNTQPNNWNKILTRFYNGEQTKKDLSKISNEKNRIRHWIKRLLSSEKYDYNNSSKTAMIRWLSGESIYRIFFIEK